MPNLLAYCFPIFEKIHQNFLRQIIMATEFEYPQPILTYETAIITNELTFLLKYVGTTVIFSVGINLGMHRSIILHTYT